MREELRVILIPVTNEISYDPSITKEIADLTAEIVLLGRKKRRSEKKTTEVSDAA